MRPYVLAGIWLLLCSFVGLADPLNAEHRLWQHLPIKVVLPIHKDRLIIFPGSVTFNPNNDVALTKDQLHVINNDGVLYLQAKVAFAPQLIEIKLNQTGKVILLNVSAKQKAGDGPISIVLPTTNPSQNDNPVFHSSLAYVHLTRFAIQQLYAPKQLLHNLPGVYRVPMRTNKTVHLILGAKVIALPLISWRGGDYYETAVLLRNQLNHAITVSPHDLLGRWLAVSFYPNTMLAANKRRGDTTTAFLISNEPFMTALEDND